MGTVLFPLDNVKTHLQLGKSLPSIDNLYRGFMPACYQVIVGRASWTAMSNALERSIPDLQDPILEHWKHFISGGITSTIVTCAVFPLETLKIRGQVSNGDMLHDALALLKEDGLRRFYRGVEVKLASNSAFGAVFNSVFVACSRSLEALWQQQLRNQRFKTTHNME